MLCLCVYVCVCVCVYTCVCVCVCVCRLVYPLEAGIMCLDIHEQQPALVAVGLYDGRCGVLTVGLVY